MKVSIHQPQYIPWLPYFTKVEESDLFILLDSVDFQKNGLQNRNQIKAAQGAQWLTVPVRQRLGQRICDVEIDNSTHWKKKHAQSFQNNYGKAAAYSQYADELAEVFARDWNLLVDVNIHLITLMLKWLGIHTKVLRSSEMAVTGRASELVLNLCRDVGATTYISGTGGRNYLDEKSFLEANVTIEYRPPVLPTLYPQMHPKAGFLDSLSAMDVILNCGADWRKYMPEGGGVA